MPRYEIALAPEVRAPPPTIERLKRQLIEVVSSLEVVSPQSQLWASVEESALSIRIDNWRFLYTIDQKRSRISVIDAEA